MGFPFALYCSSYFEELPTYFLTHIISPISYFLKILLFLKTENWKQLSDQSDSWLFWGMSNGHALDIRRICCWDFRMHSRTWERQLVLVHPIWRTPTFTCEKVHFEPLLLYQLCLFRLQPTKACIFLSYLYLTLEKRMGGFVFYVMLQWFIFCLSLLFFFVSVFIFVISLHHFSFLFPNIYPFYGSFDRPKN